MPDILKDPSHLLRMDKDDLNTFFSIIEDTPDNIRFDIEFTSSDFRKLILGNKPPERDPPLICVDISLHPNHSNKVVYTEKCLVIPVILTHFLMVDNLTKMYFQLEFTSPNSEVFHLEHLTCRAPRTYTGKALERYLLKITLSD